MPTLHREQALDGARADVLAQFKALFEVQARIEAKLEDVASATHDIKTVLLQNPPTVGGSGKAPASSAPDTAESDVGQRKDQSCLEEPMLDWPSQLLVRPVYKGEEDGDDPRRTESRISLSLTRSHDSRVEIDEDESHEHGRKSPMMINPNSATHMFRSGCAFLMVLFELSVTPFVLAWDVPLTTFLTVQSWASAIVWSLDIAVNFRTGVYTRGNLQMDAKVVARSYSRTWFPLDVSVVACDWLVIGSVAVTESAQGDDAGALRLLRFTKLGRLMRIFGMLRMMRAVRIFEEFMEMNLPEEFRFAFKITVMFFTSLWIAHLGCCLWFVVGVSGPSDTGVRWIDGFGHMRDGLEVGFLESPTAYQYTTAFHSAAAHIASGALDQMPTNTLERMFFSLAILTGFLFGGSLIASLTSTMVQYQLMRTDRIQKMRVLRQYLCQRQVESNVAVLVQKQAAERLGRRARPQESDVALLQILSTRIREKLHFAVQEDHLARHPLLRLWIFLDHALMVHLSWSAIGSLVVQAKDDMFAAHTPANHAYLLGEGAITYKQDELLTVHGAPSRKRVVAGQWLSEAAMWSQWTHMGTATADTLCELFVLDVSKVGETIPWSPVLHGLARDYAQQFHRRLTSAYPPHGAWPTDLHVPFTDYCDLVVSMSQGAQEVIGLAALGELPKSLRWSRRRLRKLKEEISTGKSIVVTTGEGDIFRLVSLVVLRIEGGDQRVFAHVGKWSDGQASPNCQLPGAKLLRDELTTEAVERAFREKLPWFCGGVDMSLVEQEKTEKMSSEFGVMTRYLRTICTGRLKSEPGGEQPWPLVQMLYAPSAPDVSSNVAMLQDLLSQEVLAVWDGQNANLFAWLSPQEFDFLSSGSGSAVLEAWLSHLQAPEHSLASDTIKPPAGALGLQPARSEAAESTAGSLPTDQAAGAAAEVPLCPLTHEIHAAVV